MKVIDIIYKYWFILFKRIERLLIILIIFGNDMLNLDHFVISKLLRRFLIGFNTSI
mgnify:CR=1 FL=1